MLCELCAKRPAQHRFGQLSLWLCWVCIAAVDEAENGKGDDVGAVAVCILCQSERE